VHPVSLVTLQQYLTVLGRSSAGTERFHPLRQPPQIGVLIVYALDDGHGFAELSGFQTDLDALLFPAYFSADADVLW